MLIHTHSAAFDITLLELRKYINTKVYIIYK